MALSSVDIATRQSNCWRCDDASCATIAGSRFSYS